MKRNNRRHQQCQSSPETMWRRFLKILYQQQNGRVHIEVRYGFDYKYGTPYSYAYIIRVRVHQRITARAAITISVAEDNIISRLQVAAVEPDLAENQQEGSIRPSGSHPSRGIPSQYSLPLPTPARCRIRTCMSRSACHVTPVRSAYAAYIHVPHIRNAKRMPLPVLPQSNQR